MLTGQLVRHRNTNDIGTFVRTDAYDYPVVNFGIGDETIDPWYLEPLHVHYVDSNGEITTQ